MSGWKICITKTCLYNFDPLKPHFYIVKLGFTGVYIIFLISAQKHRLWVLVRTALSRRFLRLPTIYVLNRNMKNIRFFLSENFQFLEVNFSTYLNRRVFVMEWMNGQTYTDRHWAYYRVPANMWSQIFMMIWCLCPFQHNLLYRDDGKVTRRNMFVKHIAPQPHVYACRYKMLMLKGDRTLRNIIQFHQTLTRSSTHWFQTACIISWA